MEKTTEVKNTVQTLINQLAEAAYTVSTDNLPGLAKMHGWCESLLEAVGPKSSFSYPELSEPAQMIATLLQQIILDEVENAKAAVEELVTQIDQLSRIQIPESGTPRSLRDGQAKTGEEVAACLDKVFEDKETHANSATLTSVDRKAGKTAEARSATPVSVPDYVSEPLIVDDSLLIFVQAFVIEAAEHLDAIEAAVLEVERHPNDLTKIDDLFRPFHTIKGSSGSLNLRDICSVTHEVETLMDQCRKGDRPITARTIDLILEVEDVLKLQVDAVAGYAAHPTGEPIPQPPVADLIGKLRSVVASPAEDKDCPVVPNSGSDSSETVCVPPTALASTKEEMVSRGVPDKPADHQGGAQNSNVSISKPNAVTDQSIRVDTSKLDALVNIVGELVIAQTLVSTLSSRLSDPQLSRNVEQVNKIVRDAQGLAMSLRMIPIGPTFQKMVRLVRDLAKQSGKKVAIQLVGEDTELDKTVIQQIGDPLVHMIRNAVDHGIEMPAERIAAGKSEEGVVHLRARHQDGNIIIEIADDGKGLDPQKLIAKAMEKGLIQEGQSLSEQDAYQLIFEPGFSTAEKITNISGRGVGMDVVRRSILQLRGKIEIESNIGVGTTFCISLPLTLAIIDGMVVLAGKERFIIPLIEIEQSLRPQVQQISTVHQRGEMMNVRGRLIPLVQLAELFGTGPRVDPWDAMVVIVHVRGRSVGLVVDELVGQQQVVIKALGDYFKQAQGISGGAILGDGQVGLILELGSLKNLFECTERTRLDKKRVVEPVMA